MTDRFSFVASLPLTDAQDAAVELKRATGLGAVAAMVSANIQGTNIGECELDPLWAAAQAQAMPIIVHPVLVEAAPRAARFGLTQIAQYTFDTTLGVGSLIFSGVLDRFPTLSLILSHGGGAFPYLLGRFDVMHARMDRAGQGDVAQKAPSAYAGRIGYDTILHAPKALRFLADAVGIGQLALGTDEAFPPADRDPMASLKQAGFSAAEIGLDCGCQSAPAVPEVGLIWASFKSQRCKGTSMDVDLQNVFARIDRDELIKVALDLGNIDSPTGREGPVADYVQDWLRREGFDARKVGLYPDRPNVLATLPGSGNGRSLCFNSHMDTAVHHEEWWATRNASDPIFHSAWREDDMLVGNGIVNDKGPMATWLMAAKAIKDSGVKLKGDLVLMAVVGEIGVEPVDEFQPPEYIAKEAGTRYAITHGGVADYALVAEGTDFGIVGVEAGKAFFKITVFGNDYPIYTPYIPRPSTIENNPNAIVRMTKLIQRIEEWALEYENKYRYECAGGIVQPKINIGAIRGGVPWKITKTVQQCAIYLDVRITPVQEPLDIREELRRPHQRCRARPAKSSSMPIGPASRPTRKKPSRSGARSHGPTARSWARSRTRLRCPASSMWRDVNCFNEMRIPSLTYGPGVSSGGGKYAMKIENMILGTKLYAQTAIELCSQERS